MRRAGLACTSILFLAGIVGGSPHSHDPCGTIDTTTYAVDGPTPAEILRQLYERGPTDEFGKRRFAFTGWKVRWLWPKDDSGYRYGDPTVRCTISMTVPRWEGSPLENPATAAEWYRFMDALMAHERRHAELVSDRVREIRDDMRAYASTTARVTSEKMNRVGFEKLDTIREADTSYDADTRHGLREGVAIGEDLALVSGQDMRR